MTSRQPGSWTRRLALTGVTVALIGGGIGIGYGLADRGGEGTSEDRVVAERQAQVAERGADVMPFDLDRTTHVFTDQADGGTQVVTADDPEDAEQIELIREHLRHEAGAFADGIFDDPATIHGDDMPGLAELRAGADQISVTYEDVPAGGQLTYTTRDPQLVEALHAWFDAQVGDHGEHAERG